MRRMAVMDETMFHELKKEVIDPGFCVLCGACSGFCDRIELDYEGAIPRLVGSCVKGCSNCYDHCPMRAGFDPSQVFGKTEGDPIIGPYTEVKAVRAADEEVREKAQDGGAVTAILSAILDRGKIDAAVVVERDEKWRPIPRIVTSKDGLASSRGSKYSPSPNADELGRVFRREDIKSVAVVDVGCHIRAIRNMEYGILYNAGFSPYSDLKIYTIGLFCSGNFIYRRLLPHLKEPEAIKKMDVTRGMFTASGREKESRPVSQLEDALMPSCHLCGDYTAELADLSVGSIGSPEGYSTVIARNLMGWGMLRDAVQRGYAEADPGLVDMEALKKTVKRKREKALRRINREREQGKATPGYIQCLLMGKG